LNNKSNKSYLSLQILNKEKVFLSKLKVPNELTTIKNTFSSIYKQHVLRSSEYIEDNNLSLNHRQEATKIKLSIFGNADLYFIKSMFSEGMSSMNEGYKNENIAIDDNNKNERIDDIPTIEEFHQIPIRQKNSIENDQIY